MQFRKRNISLLLSLTMLCGSLSALPEERRIAALLTIKDYHQACHQAALLVQSHPEYRSAWNLYIKALSKEGDEKKIFSIWHHFSKRFPEDKYNRELLEEIAWGIIEKGSLSPSPLVRVYSALGAFTGQDAKSIPVLRKSLQDSNPQIRAVAINLASSYRDSSLQELVYKLLFAERNALVRIEAIKAMGKMKIESAEPSLIEILSGNNATAEEKAAAIEALVNLMEMAKRDEIKKLIDSKRAGLRDLACRVVSHTFDYSNSDLLIPLLKDHCSDVRAAAVQAMGLLRKGACQDLPLCELITPLLYDPDPNVAISACWAITFCTHDETTFLRWLFHPNKELRHFASGALAATGKYGVPIMLKAIDQSPDPFIKVNLALGLIAERVEVSKASKILSAFLEETNERIMWKKEGHIRYIAASNVKFTPLIPNLPESTNHITRLELLNVLAILEVPEAPASLRSFLKKRGWGVSGLAAALLLTEGDDESIEIVEELLKDPERKIRMQAAMILALWGRGENAITVLHDSYRDADREMKERVIEGIGQIGSESSIPFLVDLLKEPSQTLRIIAAASLLKCLYH